MSSSRVWRWAALAFCTADRALYVTDTDNNQIRKITLNGTVSFVAGSAQSGMVDGGASVARFNRPTGIACDDAGTLYVADSRNNMVRAITANGTVTTLAGNGSAGTIDGVGAAARFSDPGDLVFDSGSASLYVVDWGSNDVRSVSTGKP